MGGAEAIGVIFKEHSCQEITAAQVGRQSYVVGFISRKNVGKRSGGGPVRGPFCFYLMEHKRKEK